MATIREKLGQMLPGVQCFLDVYDLADVSRLEAYVEESAVFLLFLSRAYFTSANCLREVRAAVALDKPMIVVYEPSADHGGGVPRDLLAGCPPEIRRVLDDVSFIRWSIKPGARHAALA